MTEAPFEGPTEDVADQRADVIPGPPDEADPAAGPDDVGWDVDPADAREQQAEVPIDEDEWR